MSPMRQLVTSGALVLSLACSVSAQSWLQGETPPSQTNTGREEILGMVRQAPELLAYHHPFGAQALQAHQRVATQRAIPGEIYLLRTPPGPASGDENRAFLLQKQREVMSMGFQWMASPARGGAPNTPLMGIVRYRGAEARELPDWLQVAPVSGARVHLALLSLPEQGGEAWESPIAISEELSPEAAIRRAWTVYRTGAKEWGQGGKVSTEDLQKRWGAAFQVLSDHGASPNSLMLALRVIWTSGEEEIPGPGGLAIHSVEPREALPRLQYLYTGGQDR